MITIPIMATNEYSIGDFFQPMHSPRAPGAKRPVRKQARNQEQQCVSGQQVIRQSVRTSKCNDNADQSDHSQTNADHG